MTERENKEMCISREEYVHLIEEIGELKILARETVTKLGEVDTTVKLMEPLVSNVSTVVLGNGNPAHGLATRVSLMEKEVKEHKEKHTETNKKLWDIGKPAAIEAIKWLLIIGAFAYNFFIH